MTARCGDLKPAFGLFLAFNFLKVHAFGELSIPDFLSVYANRGDGLRAVQKSHHLRQVLHGQDR